MLYVRPNESNARAAFPKIFARVDDFNIAMSICMEDIAACHKLSMEQPKNQTWRRLLIRTLFSSIECWCHSINQNTTEDHLSSIKNLSAEDAAFLRGNKFAQNNKEKKNKFRFRDYFERTLRVHAAVQRTDYSIPVGENRELFLKAIIIRNRITHPRNSSDLHIGDLEFDEARKGCLWAAGCIKELFARLGTRRRGPPVARAGFERLIRSILPGGKNHY